MVHLRVATPDDVDDIVQLVLKSMPDDPQWNYRFPYREKYPEDLYKYTKILYEQFLDPTVDDWQVLVAVQDFSDDASEATASAESSNSFGHSMNSSATTIPKIKRGKITAFSVWDVSYINKRQEGPSYESQNRRHFKNTVTNFSSID